MAEVRSYELNDELVGRLRQEFAPEPVIAAFATRLGSSHDDKDVAEAGRNVFGSYGVNLMRRVLQLGEQYGDRTYELLQEAAKKTGRLYFPHIAQRFLEIAYLATQPIATVDIVENNHYRLINRMGRSCAFFTGTSEACGDAVAERMPCKYACIDLMETMYEGLRLDVAVVQEESIERNGYCRFVATNNRPGEGTPWKR